MIGKFRFMQEAELEEHDIDRLTARCDGAAHPAQRRLIEDIVLAEKCQEAIALLQALAHAH